MADRDDKQAELAKNFQQMMRTTKVDDKDNNQRKLANNFLQMIDMTKKIDSDEKRREVARQFAEMMEQSRSFDSERERLQKVGETAVADAFAKMINLTQKLEHETKSQFEFPPDVSIEHFPSAGDKFFNQLIKKLPPRIRRFPRAFRKNPRAVLKYFFAMIIGRVLAITLYVIAAFIPALPIPDSVAGIGGKLPALGVAFSFLAIKLAMVFLLPVFGGIAITVLGFKISIILIVVVRMAVSTISEIVGKLIGGKFLRYCKKIYNDPEILWNLIRQNMETWMENWKKNQR